MWSQALTMALICASQLSGVVGSDVFQSMRSGSIVDRNMRRYADAIVEDHIVRRQATSLPKMNITAWDAQTTAACMSSLMMLNGRASNPAGMAVCYNLPFLDNSTGLFQADLRLYMVSAPTGDFAGIPPQNVTVGLQYFGASVQTLSPSDLTRRSMLSWPSSRNKHGVERRQSMMPTMIQSYAFVGQINKNLMTPNMNTTTLEGLLIPVVSLSAQTSTGSSVNATLSSDEATFVNGVFADAANATAVAEAAASASAIAAAQAAAAPFVLPGTKISIFPIGAIITGVWAIVGFATVAYGTVGRIGFREQYRRRLARAEKGGYARI